MPNWALIKEKDKQVFAIMKELDIDCWLIWVRETSQMADPVLELIYEGDLVWQSAIIYTKKGEKLAIVGSHDIESLKAKKLFDRLTPYTESLKGLLVDEIKNLDPNKIAVNYSVNDASADGLSTGMFKLLQEYLRGTEYNKRLCSAENLISKLRGHKTRAEIDRIKRAIRITETIFEKAKLFVKVGMTEKKIYHFFREQMREYSVTGAWNVDHNPAVNAGPNKEHGHVGPTNNKTKAGHLLNFDFGVRYKGYCSDLQRMFFFGSEKEIPEEVKDAFETIREAIRASADFIKPGLQGYEVDAVARDMLKERGYGEYKHSLGHQLGRQAHDGATILGPLWERYGNTPKGIIEAGNVFTLEPSLVTKNYGGVSLEEDILVTKGGCEFLSKPQHKLVCIK